MISVGMKICFQKDVHQTKYHVLELDVPRQDMLDIPLL